MVTSTNSPTRSSGRVSAGLVERQVLSSPSAPAGLEKVLPRVGFTRAEDRVGQFVDVTITGANEYDLIADIIEE